MKYLTALFLFSSPARALEQDLALHFLGSYAITQTTYSALRAHHSSKFKSHALSILLSASAGLAKEYVLDSQADQRDLAADALGIGTAVLVPFVFQF
jgi:hypothetical protein